MREDLPKFESLKKQIKLLENLDPEDPRLLEYFEEIKKTFTGQIPWLEKSDLSQAKTALLSVDEKIAGGMLTLEKCPENQKIQEDKEKLLGPGGVFASCLYINELFRGQGLWKNLLKAEIDRADELNTFVWGVVGEPHLLDLYTKYFGAEVHALSGGLHLVKFTKNNYISIENGKKL